MRPIVPVSRYTPRFYVALLSLTHFPRYGTLLKRQGINYDLTLTAQSEGSLIPERAAYPLLVSPRPPRASPLSPALAAAN